MSNVVELRTLPLEAQKVRFLRSALGLSQSKFAERYGVDVKTVYGWESGKYESKEARVIELATRDLALLKMQRAA